MRTALVLIALLVAGCGPTVYGIGDVPKFWLVDPCKNEVVLGAGDVLSINVWGQKDLDTEATVRPDGMVTMPLVGDIRAAGQTPSALRVKIKTELDKYLKLTGNEVTVGVKTYMSYRFTVQGEVGKPGQFSSPSCVNVSDAVALAGGPTRFAKRDSMVLMRKDSKGESQSITISYDLIASGKRPDLNVWILPEDVLYMP
jgi:polysaccharide biosynthesis/export protein